MTTSRNRRWSAATESEGRVAIENWIAIDAEHGDALSSLLDSDPSRAAGLFGGRLTFGTAGLRAEMGPGPMRMNRLVVRQTTAGLLRWLADARSVAQPTVVVGFDARHNSKTFARDVAAVVMAFGGHVALIDRPAPTPVLARAVLDQQADAGIMITASHNPPQDNGYKLYLGDGLQIVPPADLEIASAIEAFAETDPLSGPEPEPTGSTRTITDEAIVAHQRLACAVLRSDAEALEARRQLRVVYTPIHGVGGEHFVSCMEMAGFAHPSVVSEEFAPNPDFPGTRFPNPEEPGTLDRALSLAVEQGVDVLLANDPDADRLAVALPDSSGRWTPLTGDEIGVLLADQAISQAQRDPSVDLAHCQVSSSVVSSQMIERLASAAGVRSVRTLTGFKWVARPMVEQGAPRFLFGYEEALGYCIGDRVRDKDGVSAALAMADLVADLKSQNLTLRDRLDQLSVEHGMHTTTQVTVRFDHVAEGQRAQAMAEAASLAPAELAGISVTNRVDLSLGEGLPPTPGVVLSLADGSRVLVRPSGTEPKVKVYVEVRSDVSSIEEIERVRGATNRRVKELAAACKEILTG